MSSPVERIRQAARGIALQMRSEPAVEAQTSLQALLSRALTSRELAILIVTIVLFVLFALINDRFVSQNNLVGIIRRMPTLGIVAVAMTFLLVAGGGAYIVWAI